MAEAAKKAVAKKVAKKAATSTPAGRTAATAAPIAKKAAPAKKTAPRKAPAKKTSPSPAAEQRAAARESRASERHAAFQRREAARSAPGPGRAKKAVSWAWSGNRRLLTAQFVLCVVVLGAGWLVAPAAGSAGQGSKASSETTTRAMIKFTALAALFFLLALVSSAGKGGAKAATALGTLVTATYVFTSSDAHAVMSFISSFFSNGDVPIGAGETGSVFTPGETSDTGTPSSAFGPQP